ncbi:MAG: hypothetical protein N3G20_10770 [Verrucomicrobiae bacterium]|nr:hypothetical protein [Verrucomicrobiae bacterium]
MGTTNAVLVFSVTGTNQVRPTLWYATNLLEANPWKQVTNSFYTGTNGTYLQWFEPLAGVPGCFYRITAPTNAP